MLKLNYIIFIILVQSITNSNLCINYTKLVLKYIFTSIIYKLFFLSKI